MSMPGLWQAPNGQGNPDGRPLPPGFVTQFDPGYSTWFYVNTTAQPPRSQWLHPADHHDQNNPPSGGVNWDARYPAQGGNRDLGGGLPPGQYAGGYGGPGGSYGPGGGYPPPAQPKSSSNTGAMLAAGGVGLVGGALIASALSDDNYQDGYEAGQEAAEEEN
ncbi:hypothetical protein FRC10_008872 [Ceratobasidium sp. 414]|nr:hypothetical protein FRC10_008872 [Ceratobasidium sp. 414]